MRISNWTVSPGENSVRLALAVIRMSASAHRSLSAVTAGAVDGSPLAAPSDGSGEPPPAAPVGDTGSVGGGDPAGAGEVGGAAASPPGEAVAMQAWAIRKTTSSAPASTIARRRQ